VLAHVALGRIGARFALAYPEVQLEIVAEDRVVDLAEDAYDLVIRINPSPDERLVGRCFLNDERLIVATPDVPRPCPTTEGEDVIVKSVLLGTRPAPAVWRMRSAAEKDIVLKPEPVLRLSSLLMVRDAVLAGAGAALLPSFSSPTTSRRAGLHIGEPMPVHRWKSGRSRRRALHNMAFSKGTFCAAGTSAQKVVHFNRRCMWDLHLNGRVTPLAIPQRDPPTIDRPRWQAGTSA
jgi:DNA-binding transcriptional LysR family regulator